MNPRQIIGKDKTVLPFDGGQKSRTSNCHRAIAEPYTGQATIYGRERHAGETELAGDVFVEIELEAMRIDPVVAKSKLIH